MNHSISKLFVVVAIFLLSGCTTYNVYKANKLVEQGNYKQSVQVVTDRFDKLGELPGTYNTRKMTEIINQAITHYENNLDKQIALNKNFDQKISAYNQVLWLRKQLDQKFYSSLFPDFIAKYKISDLNISIAEQYYLKGNDITPVTAKDYLNKYNIYAEGLKYANYKDMKELRDSNHKQYATLTAEENYQKALLEAKAGKYYSATNLIEKAINVYKPYGTYKDSDKLFVQYDKTWRLADANIYYDAGKKIVGNARYKADHRAAAAKFKSAHDVYARYAKFKDAQVLAEQHKRLGIVYITLRYNGNDSSISKEISNALNKTFAQAHYQTPKSGDRNNIKIQVSYTTSYRVIEDKEEQRDLRKKGKEGEKTKHFKEIKRNRANEYELETTISVSGDLIYNDSFKVYKTSSEEKITYTGDVPEKSYYDSTNGNYLSESSLKNMATNDMINKLNSKLNTIYQSTEQL